MFEKAENISAIFYVKWKYHKTLVVEKDERIKLHQMF